MITESTEQQTKVGDRFTCEIKRLDSDVLYVRLDYALGTVSINWSKVDHIESKQLFLVRTHNGSVYTGTLSTVASAGARPVGIEVAGSSAKSTELDKSEINQVEQTTESFLQRFNGQIGAGSTYYRGNQSVQYNLNANVTYPRERWAATASYNSNLSSNNGAPLSTRNDIDLTALHLLRWNNWYYAGLTGFLQSAQQGISLQSTFGGGVGRYLKRTNKAVLTLTGGFGWQQINYQQNVLPSTAQHVASALVASRLQLYFFDKTNLDVTGFVLPALSDPGRVHSSLNAAYYVRLWRKLEWNVTFYGNWDNHPCRLCKF